MKYKVGDKVLIKSIDWYNENKDKYGFVDFRTSVFVPGMSQFCGKIVTIEDVFEEEDDVVYCMEGIDYDWTDEMIEGLAEEETTNVMDENKMLIGWIKEPNRYRLVPDKDYEIKYDEKGFFYLEKKKKEYPKTYEECCKYLGIQHCGLTIDLPLNYSPLFIRLAQLYICRNAYWKIAGDEMGLGKPWEPDYNIRGYYAITRSYGNVIKISNYTCDLTFVFPTEEMRDAFYENFKELIELCKELL